MRKLAIVAAVRTTLGFIGVSARPGEDARPNGQIVFSRYTPALGDDATGME